MSMFGPIPLPANDNHQFKDVMDFFAALQARKTQQEQFAQELEVHKLDKAQAAQQFERTLSETSNYHKGLLDYKNKTSGSANEKNELNLELLRQKILTEKNKKNKGIDELTTANITKNQGIVQSIDAVLPLIQSISPKNAPGQIIGKYFSPNKEADYESRIATITDSLIGALGLPKTNESIDLTKKMVMRGNGESDKAYQKRLNNLSKDIQNRRTLASKSLKSGLSVSSNEDNVEGEEAPPGTVWMIRPDNVKVPVHEDNVNHAISKYKYKLVE